jgi:hypothetical protein
VLVRGLLPNQWLQVGGEHGKIPPLAEGIRMVKPFRQRKKPAAEARGLFVSKQPTCP